MRMANDNSEGRPSVAGRRLQQSERRLESDTRMLRASIHLIAHKGVGQATLAAIGVAAGYSSGLPIMRSRIARDA